MLDEPAAGLDEVESRELASLIRRLADERGMGVLLVEHDVGLVMSTCDRIVVMEFGHVIASGTPEEVRNNAAVVAAYLGESTEQPRALETPVEVMGE
jgi:sulfate-transporting ATPase